VFKKWEKVNMSDLNEKLAQEAAELINGGEWRDGKWYSDGQRDAWRRALKPAANRIEKLEAVTKDDAKWLAAYHKWCEMNGCAPSSSDLIIARKALEDKQ
jgi:hypothetical protein